MTVFPKLSLSEQWWSSAPLIGHSQEAPQILREQQYIFRLSERNLPGHPTFSHNIVSFIRLNWLPMRAHKGRHKQTGCGSIVARLVAGRCGSVSIQSVEGRQIVDCWFNLADCWWHGWPKVVDWQAECWSQQRQDVYTLIKTFHRMLRIL